MCQLHLNQIVRKYKYCLGQLFNFKLGRFAMSVNAWRRQVRPHLNLKTCGACILKLTTAVIYCFRSKLQCLSLPSLSIQCLGTNTLAYYGNCKLRVCWSACPWIKDLLHPEAIFLVMCDPSVNEL